MTSLCNADCPVCAANDDDLADAPTMRARYPLWATPAVDLEWTVYTTRQMSVATVALVALCAFVVGLWVL